MEANESRFAAFARRKGRKRRAWILALGSSTVSHGSKITDSLS